MLVKLIPAATAAAIAEGAANDGPVDQFCLHTASLLVDRRFRSLPGQTPISHPSRSPSQLGEATPYILKFPHRLRLNDYRRHASGEMRLVKTEEGNGDHTATALATVCAAMWGAHAVCP